MSKVMDTSQLESLSNAELRTKCIEYGLPNVPVTDSSRNVLLKKLRLVMGGGPTSSTGTVKKTNRRETIHVVPSKPTAAVVKDTTISPDAEEQDVSNRQQSRLNNRRTIAATTSAIKEQKPVTVAPETGPTSNTSCIPAPIGNRRRSSVREQLVPVLLPSSQGATAPITSAKKNRPVVILESDDEDEVDLILAAEQAEKIEKVNTEQRRNRAGSLPKTVVKTTSYQQANTQLQEKVERQPSSSTMIHHVSRNLPGAEPLITRKTFIPPPSSNRYSLDSANAATQRYSSTQESYSSPALRRNTAQGASSITTSSKQFSKPRVSSAVASSSTTGAAFYNEMSDDTDTGADNANEITRSPFLSNFARSLDQIKSEKLGSSSRTGQLFGSDSGTNVGQRKLYRRPYEGGARQPINQFESESLGESFRQLMVALERKYHLMRNGAFLFLILLIVYLFYVFWQ